MPIYGLQNPKKHRNLAYMFTLASTELVPNLIICSNFPAPEIEEEINKKKEPLCVLIHVL